MPDLVVYERRRAGGDRPGVVRVRRRAGGDVSLSRRAPSTPVIPAGEDVVTAFLSRRPFYISHRMGGTEYPEFTQAGLDASLRAGFKALELSVRRCASGELIAIHDWKTSRTAPGTDYQIWSTLRQASGGFMRLTEIVDQVPDDIVLAIDHKTTSSGDQTNPRELASEEQLFDYLDTTFGGHPERRVLWKVFAKGTSAKRAKARGYKVMAMLYPNEVATSDLSQWDVIGMEWSAGADVWNRLNASGKPTIAHIIVNDSQARQALAKGATGLMASYPSLVHP